MTPLHLRWAFILVLTAGRLHGQTTQPQGPEPDERGGSQIQPVVGLRYGAPLGASFYGGLILSGQTTDYRQGPSLTAEVGQDGIRAGLGVSSVSLGGTYRAQVSLMRTWDPHGDIQADQTYVGPEVALGLLAGVTLGHYWRISDGGGPARLFAIGSFIGF
jgi:hypothetical protein